MQTFVRWAAESGRGLEHLDIRREPHRVVTTGVVIGDRFGVGYGAHYQIEMAEDWSVRKVRVMLADGRELSLSADGVGTWHDSEGNVIPQLNGCIDIDVSATPFSNSLPIKRLGLRQGERTQIRVAYLAIPSLTVECVDQAYTCIEPGRRYRYEGLFRNFEADLCLDEQGLVMDYPSLFRRVE
jgi:hypothetical protein